MKLLTTLLGLSLTLSPLSAQALTLQGGVEKSNIKRSHSSEGRIGVRMSWSGRVARVQPDSPAARAGVQADDHVVSVDGRHYSPGRITGEPGTNVELEISRMGQRLRFVVERVDAQSITY